ncbi:MAG TPA: LON peptidase substrate-binding domain-containing protein [Casimicrobiaceae bacterium]|jgi:Lon protease-like protein|nr:LON peptidase substrate-binding domain-containing protein [Casimicrobiaceae bacterium]
MREAPRTDRKPWSLPLFPLRTVLFPGGILPLKIFEQRYVEMTKSCLRDERPFGVCMITEGQEVAQPDAPIPSFANVGTLAQITNFDMPQLGILHVQTHGLTRFEVRSHSVDSTGLVIGEVTTIGAEPSHPLPETYAPLAKILGVIAARLGPENFPATTAYGDASWVGYRLAELLPLPLTIKQRMLEVNDANVRLTALNQFLERQGLV